MNESILDKCLNDYRLFLGKKELLPIVLGGMGVNISTKELALEVARCGGIGHISDAMMPDVSDRLLGTHFTAAKAKLCKAFAGLAPKPDMHFDLESIRRATKGYVEDVMSAKKGDGLVFINVMEKLTMNDPLGSLKARLNAALDAGIDGISLSAGLHTSSFGLMADNPRFRDAKLGIVVSSVRALNIFLRRTAKTERLPDFVVVEGPLAGGHLGFGFDWANFKLSDIVRDVKQYLAEKGLSIPLVAGGGVFTGTDGVRLMEEGADAVQVATRFTIARESGIPDDVKQRYFNAEKDEIVVNGISPTGYPMRMLACSPAINANTKPQCEAYGYMLDHGECQYLKAYREAVAEHRSDAQLQALDLRGLGLAPQGNEREAPRRDLVSAARRTHLPRLPHEPSRRNSPSRAGLMPQGAGKADAPGKSKGSPGAFFPDLLIQSPFLFTVHFF